ncbi:MAG: SPASM domain-containing protein [Polyangia bacterium]
MTLPFTISRYLRPFLDEQGEPVLDNGVTGQRERLSPLERAIVEALWDEGAAPERLSAVVAAHGQAAVQPAILSLYERAVIFESHAAADELLDELLDARCPRVPFLDQIELTNRCPMRCGFCPRGVPGKMSRPTGFMELALFRRLLEQLPDGQAAYRPLELHHLGESLLHPQVADFVAAATERGLPTEMSVNPSLLTPELGRRLLDAGLRRLVVSLDGLDDPTLVRIRGPAARYTRAEPNLEALVDEVAARGDAAPQIVIQMIDLHANRDQHAAFLLRWGTTGLKTVTAYIKALDGPDPDDGEAGTAGREPLRYLCSYPFRSVVVLWDGRVVPCCRDDDGRLILGDLNRQTLEEIWHGPVARELRRRHRRNELPKGHLCSGCAWSRASFAAAHPSRHPSTARRAPLQW